ncbi:MAG TPA: VWA domain-containing protein [Pyrinomonadaceae bacterium]
MNKLISHSLVAAGLICASMFSAAAQTSGPRVELSLIVADKDNKAVDTVRKEDVHVFEGKVEQTILSVEPDTRPIDLALAIDCSGSFRKWLPAAVQAAGSIVRSARPEDEIFIERFISSDKIENVQEFSRDTRLLLKRIDDLYVEGGQSAIADALYVAVQHLVEHNQTRADRRKVVVVLTDGEDRNSYYRAEGVIQLARAHDVQVFVLALTSDLKTIGTADKPSPRERAEKFAKLVAKETGGQAFLLANGQELTFDAVPHFISALRNQFIVAYQSSDDSGKEGFRVVEVKVDEPSGEKRMVTAPHAYYFPIGSAPPIERKKP